MAKRVGQKIKMTSIDELLCVPSVAGCDEIEVAKIRPFKDHPFKVLDDEKMHELVESIMLNGVLVPVTVRPLEDGNYEMISGHRRLFAVKEIGLERIPAIVKKYDDDEAVLEMVDSNLQREEILPSEKARAYRMKYDAMKHQGSGGGNTLDEIGESAGDSGKTVQRYICLSNLTDTLLGYVDTKKLPIVSGVQLSYLKEKEQVWIEDIISETEIVVSSSQAEKIKGYSQSGELTKALLKEILMDEKPKPRKFVMKDDKISKFFSDDVTDEEIEETIIRLLEEWRKKK